MPEHIYSMLKVNCLNTKEVEDVAVGRQKILTSAGVLEVCQKMISGEKREAFTEQYKNASNIEGSFDFT